ncbi:MAG TPA: glucosamine-6-phosphate deaminase [Planctomycetota bacterium]|nr:glucosamine-6-phosphate deaminase [Planctomycetota bacterium]
MPSETVSPGETFIAEVEDAASAARLVADEIETLATEAKNAGRPLVLGLAAGRTPVAVYDELARRVAAGSLDLSDAIAFNLDEYCGLDARDPRSFRVWMRERFFDRVGWPASRTRIPAGASDSQSHVAQCAAYERAIEAAGGLDLQLLGLGRNGHIGFNEPGSERVSRTRLVRLAPATIEDAAADFGGKERVPKLALTMGVATILDARRVRLLAFGEPKRAALERALQGPTGSDCPASFLREHSDVRVYADAAALGQSLPRKTSR